jgi:hypothetical protein
MLRNVTEALESDGFFGTTKQQKMDMNFGSCNVRSLAKYVRCSGSTGGQM